MRTKAADHEYKVIKDCIKYYSGIGKRGIHTPTICWPETLEKLRGEGYDANDSTITWA